MTEKEEMITLELPLKEVKELMTPRIIPMGEADELSQKFCAIVHKAYKKTLPTPIDKCVEEIQTWAVNLGSQEAESRLHKILTKHFGGDDD